MKTKTVENNLKESFNPSKNSMITFIVDRLLIKIKNRKNKIKQRRDFYIEVFKHIIHQFHITR